MNTPAYSQAAQSHEKDLKMIMDGVFYLLINNETANINAKNMPPNNNIVEYVDWPVSLNKKLNVNMTTDSTTNPISLLADLSDINNSPILK